MNDTTKTPRFSGRMENRAIRLEVELWDALGSMASAESTRTGIKVSVNALLRSLAIEAMNRSHPAS